MPPKAPEIKTPQDLLAFIREIGTAQITALNGLLDKVPENLKAEYLTMREKLNGILAGLKPLDQIPAAQEAGWALNSFARTLSDIFEYADSFRARIETMTSELSAKATALNGLNEQVEKGLLLSKDKVELAVDGAKAEAIKPFQLEIAELRKNQVALLGLPEAPEALLAGPADAFTAGLDQAKKNLAQCTAKGMAANGRGAAFIKKSVWLSEQAFNGEAQILEDLAAGLKLNLQSGDPMHGAPGTKGGSAENVPPPAKPYVLA